MPRKKPDKVLRVTDDTHKEFSDFLIEKASDIRKKINPSSRKQPSANEAIEYLLKKSKEVDEFKKK